MIDKVLQIIAPHPCCSCHSLGSLLCKSCIYNITDEIVNHCLSCSIVSRDGLCKGCRKKVFYKKSWCVGWRTEILEELINYYKFEYAKAAHKPLAHLLDVALPVLPDNTVVIPIPTIGRHIRQRGYDHTLLLAKTFAKRRQLRLLSALKRRTISVQREATSAKERQRQAAQAFWCSPGLDETVPYLIIDDVVTTGATINAAASCLKEAGAKHIYIGAIARNPLDSRVSL